MNWDDLQTLEALVRTGSVAAAGRELALRHSTISRRIAALEERLGTVLFARGARLVPTPLASGIAERARSMKMTAGDIAELVGVERRRREEALVVTTSDVLAPLLCAALAKAKLAHGVELLVSEDELELSPGQVDLALRPTQAPRGSLRGQRVGRLRIGVHRGPHVGGGWVLPSAALRAKRSMRWWRHVPETAPGAVVCSTLLAMRDACRAGLGRAAFPCFLAEDDARLHLEREIDGGPPVWLLAAATSGSSARLRETRSKLYAALRSMGGAFSPSR